MRIAVDLDGVLAGLQDAFLRELNTDFGTNYSTEDWESWDAYKYFSIFQVVEEKFGIEAAKHLMWRYFDLAWLIWRKMPVIHDSVDGVKYLKEKYNMPTDRVDIVSTRNRNTVGDSINWLQYHRFPYDTYIALDAFGRHSKLELDYDLYVDDSPQLAKEILDYPNKELLLFNQPWNQDVELNHNITRVFGWSDILQII